MALDRNGLLKVVHVIALQQAPAQQQHFGNNTAGTLGDTQVTSPPSLVVMGSFTAGTL